MDEGRRDQILDRVVDLMMEVRAEYLASGADALVHWDQLQSRALIASRTSARMDEWVTALRRRLQLGAPTAASSRTSLALYEEVDADDSEALDLIESTLGLIIARCRREAERRQDARRKGGKNGDERGDAGPEAA